MRARTVNFEKTGDPMKTMKIGSHRELKGQALIDKVFDDVWDELENDPKFAKKDPLIFKDDVYNWVLALLDDAEGEDYVMDPDDITADRYREFWDEISEPEPEEEDWDEMLDDVEWDDE